MRKPTSTSDPVRKGETPRQAGIRIAVGMLARREHTRQEIRDKLAQRGLEAEVVTGVIETLLKDGLLSEERFAEQFVRQRVERGDGPLKIRIEMQRRGVEEEQVELQLEAVEADWRELAENARRKRFGDEIPAEYAERARQARFLQGRGFGMEQIRRVLKGDIEDA